MITWLVLHTSLCLFFSCSHWIISTLIILNYVNLEILNYLILENTELSQFGKYWIISTLKILNYLNLEIMKIMNYPNLWGNIQTLFDYVTFGKMRHISSWYDVGNEPIVVKANGGDFEWHSKPTSLSTVFSWKTGQMKKETNLENTNLNRVKLNYFPRVSTNFSQSQSISTISIRFHSPEWDISVKSLSPKPWSIARWEFFKLIEFFNPILVGESEWKSYLSRASRKCSFGMSKWKFV